MPANIKNSSYPDLLRKIDGLVCGDACLLDPGTCEKTISCTECTAEQIVAIAREEIANVPNPWPCAVCPFEDCMWGSPTLSRETMARGCWEHVEWMARQDAFDEAKALFTPE